jgi:integrase
VSSYPRPEVANLIGIGMDDFRFHDLRHTGQTLAAAGGAIVADLKSRLGHASNAAALRYLHAMDGQDRRTADALSELARLPADPLANDATGRPYER